MVAFVARLQLHPLHGAVDGEVLGGLQPALFPRAPGFLFCLERLHAACSLRRRGLVLASRRRHYGRACPRRNRCDDHLSVGQRLHGSSAHADGVLLESRLHFVAGRRQLAACQQQAAPRGSDRLGVASLERVLQGRQRFAQVALGRALAVQFCDGASLGGCAARVGVALGGDAGRLAGHVVGVVGELHLQAAVLGDRVGQLLVDPRDDLHRLGRVALHHPHASIEAGLVLLVQRQEVGPAVALDHSERHQPVLVGRPHRDAGGVVVDVGDRRADLVFRTGVLLDVAGVGVLVLVAALGRLGAPIALRVAAQDRHAPEDRLGVAAGGRRVERGLPGVWRRRDAGRCSLRADARHAHAAGSCRRQRGVDDGRCRGGLS